MKTIKTIRTTISGHLVFNNCISDVEIKILIIFNNIAKLEHRCNTFTHLLNIITSTYKNAYSGLSPAAWWLSLVMLINRSGTMVLPFMTLYLTQSRNYTIGEAGFVMSLFGAGAICGGLLGGRLTDKLGFYRVQITALCGGGVMFILLGQMQSYTAICICTFILSLVNESFRPANATAISHYSKGENRTRSYSLNRLAINLGWAAGGTLGGIIATKNYHLLFWIDGITNLSAAILLSIVLAPSRNEATPTKPVEKETTDKYVAYKDKAYLFFIAMTILYSYCFFQLFTTQPVYLREHLHLSEARIGFIMAINGILIAIFEMVLIYKLEGRKNPLHYATIGTLLLGFSFVMLNIFPGAFWLAISSMLVITMGEILSMPFMNTFWSQRASKSSIGQYAGLYTIAWSTAQVLGPGTGAQIAQHYGYNVLWWCLGGLSIVTAIGYKWLEKKTRV